MWLLNLISPGSEPVTGLASGTPLNVTEAYAHEFALTLSKLLTCDVPLPESCQANDNELSGAQWDAFRVRLTRRFQNFIAPQRYAVLKLMSC